MKKKYTYLVILFLMVASSIAFGRITGNEFINFDDGRYITGNHYVQSGINQESVKWAFTNTNLSYWHPLTWLSHMLDWSLFGANATGHHLISLLLHIGASIFLFLFLHKTTSRLWPAAFAAAFFALHPLRVESVAWAAERKDVLSMFFGMACLYAYAFYAESRKLSKYLLCLILYIGALMSKPMLVTLPFGLLLLDYWPLQRFQKMSGERREGLNAVGVLLLEKIPFFCLAAVVSIMTFWAKAVAPASFGAASFGEKLTYFVLANNAIVSFVTYLGKTFWPANLALFYPYNFSLPLWKVLTAAIVLIFITVFVLYYVRKMPFLFMGWFWYLLTLVPVIGLVPSGAQATADRYTYLPSIGIAVMLAWGIPFLFQREYVRKTILFPAGMVMIFCLAVLTWQQCGYWKNSIQVWNHTLLATQDNYLAHNNRGAAYREIGRYEDAIVDYDEAIRLQPQHGLAYNNRGVVYLLLGHQEQGCRDVQKACELGICKSLEIARHEGICR